MTKKTIILTFYSLFCISSFGQVKGPSAVTPDILQRITAEVNKEAARFKDSLIKEDGLTKEYIEYAVDTFKLQHISLRKVDIDWSTPGINTAVDEMTDGYDKLMNKYYQKLMQTLDPDDKNALVNAQRAWLQFRTAEMKLVGVLTNNEKYSGGGTIQSNISVSDYSDLVVQRTDQLFDYYNGTKNWQ